VFGRDPSSPAPTPVLQRHMSTCAVSYGASRVYLLTQLVSQGLPPSSENACSDCAVSGVMPQMENRTRMVLPLIDS
jgi:hypothetical protein